MIVDQVVIGFSNNEVRRLADRIASAYNFGQQPLSDFSSLGISGLITDPTQMLDDGAPDDGRTAITGQNILDFMAFMTALQTLVNSNPSYLTAALAIAVNPQL